jgi:hypothetical protein
MARTKATQPDLKLEQIEAALRKCNGLITPTSTMLNVTRQAIYLRVKRSARLRAVIKEVTEKVLDKCESQLFKNINDGDGNMTAIIFYLKTKGRHRGYVERKETELSTDAKNSPHFTLKFIKPDDPD